MKSSVDRRKFLKLGLGTTATALAFTSLSAKAVAATCGGITPPQTKGPFYPGEANFRPENDLTWADGRPQRAEGAVVYIRGRVLDSRCRPIAGANVEIWQACHTGRYNNRLDPNPAPLDPNFRYWGETDTDADGNYFFKTIVPGAYPASEDWWRPAHIHFRVARLGYKELITQMYFKGDALNDRDLILQALPAAERELVVVDFQPSAPDLEPGTRTGVFDITLKSVRE